MERFGNVQLQQAGYVTLVEVQRPPRRAPQEPTDTAVGPFALQILEPMGRHRVALAANATGIECDLLFTPRSACIEEGRFLCESSQYAEGL